MNTRNLTRLAFLGAIALGIVPLSSCGPFVEVVKVDQATAERLQSQIQMYQSDQLLSRRYKTLKPLEATSCKNLLWDPPATEQDAANQLRFKAAPLGANGLLNMACDTGGFSSLFKNCWASVTCNATAIQVER